MSPASRYRRAAGPAGPRGAVVSWAAMKSASLTSAVCAGCLEMTQPSGRFHRWTCLCPSPVLAGSARTASDGCRFHTCRPVYRGVGQDRRDRPQRPPSRGQCRSDVWRHRHVRALEATERAERSELDILEQLRPEQWRADAVVEPDVGPPPEVLRVGWLNGVLVRLGHDRRGIVDASVFRPHNLQPDPVADRHPAPCSEACPTTASGRRSQRRPGRSAGGCPERSSRP